MIYVRCHQHSQLHTVMYQLYSCLHSEASTIFANFSAMVLDLPKIHLNDVLFCSIIHLPPYYLKATLNSVIVWAVSEILEPVKDIHGTLNIIMSEDYKNNKYLQILFSECFVNVLAFTFIYLMIFKSQHLIFEKYNK